MKGFGEIACSIFLVLLVLKLTTAPELPLLNMLAMAWFIEFGFLFCKYAVLFMLGFLCQATDKSK